MLFQKMTFLIVRSSLSPPCLSFSEFDLFQVLEMKHVAGILLKLVIETGLL